CCSYAGGYTFIC
nr:immunoglobulin light chain junction region [Macaca mulatta]